MNDLKTIPEYAVPHAVITGASQGIGKAVAERLLREGFAVHICARRAAQLNDTAQEWMQSFGAGRVFAYSADIGDPAAVTDFAAQVLKASNGQLAMLVNNAGIFLQGDLATEPEGQLEQLMQVNLYGAYNLTRALLPHMNAGCHIFNMCSVASLKAYPAGGAYSITKYALLGFSENLREELKPRGIKVTALCPGATWSHSWSGSGVPESRIMAAADIAGMLWASYALSAQADVEMIVIRPVAGDL